MERLSGFTITNNYSALEDLPKRSIELSLYYCGRENCKPGHHYGPIIRTTPMLFVFFKGKGFFKVNEKTFNIEKNDCFLIFPGENVYFEADMAEPWSNVFIAFNGSKFHEYATSAGLTKETPIRKLLETANYKYYVDEILKLHKLTVSNEIMRNVYLNLFLADLIDDYRSSSNNKDKSTYDFHKSVYVQQAVNYLVNNYQKNLRINDLSDFLGISRSYLSISFKNALGISLQAYLIDLRMSKAAELLKNTNNSIKEVASAVGYNDQFAFSRIFKKWSNLSPMEYRKSTDKLFITKTRDEYKSEGRTC